LQQRGHDIKIERPRIDLPHTVERRIETEVPGNPPFELGNLLAVAQQIEHVLLGAHRALYSPQRVTLDQLIEATMRHQQLFGHRR